MARYKTSIPLVDADTGALTIDSTTTPTLAVGSASTISFASGGVGIYASGATLSLASGATGPAYASGASLSLASGALLVANGSIAVGAPGTTSVSVATASGTTVPISQGVVRVSNTAASTSASCTLAAGTTDGQLVTIVNEAAANFVVTGNMKANQTVAASSAAQFVWVSTDTAWWRLN
jgi:hypothetical protein